MALVSIITAVYNGEQSIQRAINSVYRQKYKNWELLIVNDGSTDNTAGVLSNIRDSRVRIFHQENLGVSAARNLALSQMKGEFCCFLDSDDELPENSLAKRVEILHENPEIDFVDGKVLIKSKKSKHFEWNPTFKGRPFNELISISDRCFFGPTWMIRSNSNNVRFHVGLTHCEDLLFYIELSRLGGLYSYSEEHVYTYWRGQQSAMSDLTGLLRGYRFVYKTLFSEIGSKKSHKFKRRYRSIMFKSFINKLDISGLAKLIFRV